jgi:hypothetical protein
LTLLIQRGSASLSIDPGDKWNYGPSTAVLGMIVEKISPIWGESR